MGLYGVTALLRIEAMKQEAGASVCIRMPDMDLATEIGEELPQVFPTMEEAIIFCNRVEPLLKLQERQNLVDAQRRQEACDPVSREKASYSTAGEQHRINEELIQKRSAFERFRCYAMEQA
jgi:hypothetical protein